MNEPIIPDTAASEHPSLAPTTTVQQDITTASQRKVNLIWEYTQAVIALIVVTATMAAGLREAFVTGPPQQLPTIMSVAFGTVVGFYFSRTNHAAIGGIGSKPEQRYEGR